MKKRKRRKKRKTIMHRNCPLTWLRLAPTPPARNDAR
jgi:hypothetical protein